MRKLLIVSALLLCVGCGNEELARKTLHSSGYTSIQTTGWAPFSCGEDDTWSTGFRAKNPAGNRVTGVVCCGLIFKSCTVRF